ncbi:MAG: hypothetical protein V1928_02105 [Parcubacteria group bacterium]
MDQFDPKKIAEFIKATKQNTGLIITRDEAISMMNQQEAERWEAASTPSDRDMHRAGII